MRYLAFAFAVLFSFAAHAQTPWVIYGQTPLCPNSVQMNPTPNVNGLIGEVTHLPYTVPATNTLWIKEIGLEPLYGAGMIPEINTTVDVTAKQLLTIQAGPAYGNAPPTNIPFGSTVVMPVDYHLAAGTLLSLRLSSNWNGSCATVYSWYMSGELD